MQRFFCFFIIFLFINIFLIAQNNTEFCATDNVISKNQPWKGNNEFLIDYLKNYPLLDSNHIYFRVPVCFHIFKSNNVPDYYFYDDIKEVINRLNRIYSENKTGIFFYLSDIFFYPEKKHFIASYFVEAPFFTFKDKYKYSINVYYVDVLQKNIFGKKMYYHGVFNGLNKTITIIKHSSKTTLAHEIGHFFGLRHPHKNWEKSKLKQESVSRTRKKGLLKRKRNCEVNGDALADTPAEPNLTDYTDGDCNYTGNLTDRWGDPYEPDVNNIMSYTAKRSCRTNFTQMQKAVMLYTAKNKRNSKFWYNCKPNIYFKADNFEPDDNIYMANEIEFFKQYHTFHLIPFEKNKTLYKENKFDCFYMPKDLAFNNVQLVIEKAENFFPKMKLIIKNNLQDTLYSQIINEPTTVELPDNNKKNYIIIENLIGHIPGHFFDYYIYMRVEEL